MKKLLIFILLLTLFAGFCGCKARPKQPEERKGAREDVVVAETPKLDEPVEKKVPEAESEPESGPNPEIQAEQFFAAAKTGNRSEIQTYVDYDTLFSIVEGQNADWLFKLILERMQDEILSSDVQGDKATVFTKITNVDMGIVLPLYFKAAAELEYNNAFADKPLGEIEMETEYRNIFEGLMEEHKNGKIEKLVDMNLQKFGDDWTILPDEDLADALCGGYFSARKQVGETVIHLTPPEYSGPEKEIFNDEDEDEDDDFDSQERPSPNGDGGGVLFDDIPPA